MLTPLLMQLFFLIRRVAMALVAAGSVVAGAALLWLWFNPERAAAVATLPLIALLGLFILPACALALVRRDRRLRREQPTRVDALAQAPLKLHSESAPHRAVA